MGGKWAEGRSEWRLDASEEEHSGCIPVGVILRLIRAQWLYPRGSDPKADGSFIY